MVRKASGQELASDGWSHIHVRHNLYAESHFDGYDIEAIRWFINDQMDGFELIRLSDGADYDYALEETVRLGDYHD